MVCSADHIGGSDINVCRTLGDYDLGLPLKGRDAAGRQLGPLISGAFLLWTGRAGSSLAAGGHSSSSSGTSTTASPADCTALYLQSPRCAWWRWTR